jgi:hypothetical protein
MVTIDAEGVIRADDDKIKKFLKRHAGTYRVMSTVPRLLVLQRTDAESKSMPKTLLNGSIERPGWLIEIINFITNSRLSGDLVTVSKGVQRELIFEKGAMRVAFSTARTDLLGEFILREGILTREQLAEALKLQTPDKRLGQVLVDKGYLSGAEVYQVLQRKTESVFYDTIAIGEGLYYFISNFGLIKLPASMYMDTQALLMEGVKRIDDLEFYNQTIPQRTERLASAPGPLDGYSETERVFLSAVDGRHTLADIDAGMHLGVDEMLDLTHRMAGKDLIKTISAREMEAQTLRAVVDSYNGALDTIYTAVSDVNGAGALSASGREFIANGSHNNQTLRRLQLREDGRLDMGNIQTIYREAKERDRVKLIVMVLTQYISFVLFNAMERLPIERQEPLSSRVNEALSEIFASNL